MRRLNGSGGLTCSDDTLKRPVTALCFVAKEGLMSTTLANRWTIKPFMGLAEAFRLQVINSLWNECTVPKTYDRKIAPWISHAIQPGACTMRQTPTKTGTVFRLPTILHRGAVAIDPALRRGAIHVHVSGLPRRYGADAIAGGGQIWIAPEAFDPGSVKGARLIGHEIAHLAQQSRLGAAARRRGVLADPALEAAADAFSLAFATPELATVAWGPGAPSRAQASLLVQCHSSWGSSSDGSSSASASRRSSSSGSASSSGSSSSSASDDSNHSRSRREIAEKMMNGYYDDDDDDIESDEGSDAESDEERTGAKAAARGTGFWAKRVGKGGAKALKLARAVGEGTAAAGAAVTPAGVAGAVAACAVSGAEAVMIHRQLKRLDHLILVYAEDPGAHLGSCDAIAYVIVKKNKKFRHRLVGVMPAAGASCNDVLKVGKYLEKRWDGTLGQHRRMWADILWRNCKDGCPAARRACIELLGHKLYMLIHDYSDGGEVLTNVAARGYSFVVDLEGDTPLPPNQCLPALSPSEIARINESFARAKRASRIARDHLLQLARQSSFGNPPKPAEKLYADYFGAFDATRIKAVRDNFTKLFDAFDAEPEVVDHRNTDFGEDCYAATHAMHLPQGQKVRVWIGRDFFIEGRACPRGASPDTYAESYSKTSDATVGTLIHEFSHGVFHAVDAPPVNQDNSWRLQPDMNPGDEYGSSPDNDIQCSTRACDKRLALKDASIAVRNADNYGQFACEALMAQEKG